MKKLKKLLSIVLAVAMVLSLVVVTNAAFGSSSITISNTTSGYTYVAYQIFDGDLVGSTLSNVVWGDGVDDTATNSDGDDIYTALSKLTVDNTTYPFTDQYGDALTSAEEVAEVLTNFGDDSDEVNAFAEVIADFLDQISGTSVDYASTDGTYVISDIDDGYYLVKNTIVPDGGTYTSYILNVTGASNIDSKQSVPSMTKTVKETNDSTGNVTEWQDTADYDVGDSVPFRLTGTVASNIDDYTTYKYVFHDALSAGLNFDGESSVTVKIYSSYSVDSNGVVTGGGTATTLTSGYTVVTNPTCSVTGCDFEISFDDLKSAAEAAGVTLTANSLVEVEFTATLNDTAVVYGNPGNPNTALLEYANNPYDETETTTTPWDTVVVFTYKSVINKVDKDNNALEGAGFTLYKYDDVTGDYVAIGSEIGGTGSTITSFEWAGLDAGLYKLEETTVPTNYNSIDPIYFEIVATIDSSATYDATTVDGVSVDSYSENYLTDLSATVTGSVATFAESLTDGSLTASIVNKAGSELPSTGGIGTTIFYVVGGVLVLGAVVLLITRKRLGSED